LKLINDLLLDFLENNLSFLDLFIISSISIAITKKIKINAKDLFLKSPNGVSLSSIHRRLHDLREEGVINIQLDYDDGRKTYIVAGPNYEVTTNLIRTLVNKNLQLHLDSKKLS
jgi:hypothetical protein